jgi:hypothetical protein
MLWNFDARLVLLFQLPLKFQFLLLLFDDFYLQVLHLLIEVLDIDHPRHFISAFRKLLRHAAIN